ncbi:MFS transporter [soil metagenome]
MNPERRAVPAVMAQFFMNGVVFATWGVQIPVLKARFEVGDSMMSLAMLCVAGGAIVAMRSVGRWTTRFGSARTMTASALLSAASLSAIAWPGNFGGLLVTLLAFGMTMAAFDVSVNVQANQLEQRGLRIMSTLHGMFSLGGMAGAGIGGLLLGAGVSMPMHLALIAVTLVIATAVGIAWLLPDAPQAPPAAGEPLPSARTTSHALRILGLVAFLGLVCEGAMYDWAAIYMRDVAGTSLDHSARGYAAFSTGMAVARFGADHLRRRASEQTLLTVGAWIGFAGITLVIAWPHAVLTLVGLFLMGLGVANLMPFFFLAGARIPGMSAAEGVAGVARFAYAGMLFVPPIIGALAHGAGLRVALGAVAITMGWIAWRGIRRIHRVA